MHNKPVKVNKKRNLKPEEVESYLNWYSQIVFYPIIVKLFTLSFSNKLIEKRIFSKLGEVPLANLEELQVVRKQNQLIFYNNCYEKKAFFKFMNSIYISFLLNSWSHKHPRTALMNKKSLGLIRLVFFYKANSKSGAGKSKNSFLFRSINNFSDNQNRNFREIDIFRNVLLSGSGLIRQDNVIFSSDPAVGNCEFHAGLWDKFSMSDNPETCNILGELKNFNVTGYVKTGIDMTGRCSENYWHFMCEYLPRILNINNFPPSLPILIDSKVPISCQKLLKYYFPKNDIFYSII